MVCVLKNIPQNEIKDLTKIKVKVKEKPKDAASAAVISKI